VTGTIPAVAAAAEMGSAGAGPTAMQRLAQRRAATPGAGKFGQSLEVGDAAHHGGGSSAVLATPPMNAHASIIQKTVNMAIAAVGTAWRTIVREEVGKEVSRHADLMNQPAGPLMKAMKKTVEDAHVTHAGRALAPGRAWSEREKKVIRPEMESVFDSSLVRPIAAVAIAAMVMRLYNLPEACGDVLTPFFPPVKKTIGDKSFAVKHYNVFIDSVFKRAMVVLKARQAPPDVIRDLTNASTSKNKVTQIILAVLRVIVNDGRCLARAYWWRTTGYYIFHPSPLVYINLEDPSSPRPALEDAEGSTYFSFKRAHLASPSGLISVQQLVPPSIQLMTSDALAKTGRASRSSAATGSSSAAASPPSIPSGGALAAPSVRQVHGEVQIVATGCLYRVAAGLLHALPGRDQYKYPATVVWAVAVCLRKMLVEPRAPWTTDDGLNGLGPDERNKPGRWYVLMPTMTKRAVEDILLQTAAVDQADEADESAAAALAAAMDVLEERRGEVPEEDDLLNEVPLELPMDHVGDNRNEEGGVAP